LHFLGAAAAAAADMVSGFFVTRGFGYWVTSLGKVGCEVFKKMQLS